MKLKYFLLSCLLVIAVFVKAQNIPSYVPTNGLVGWWPFNGNANDESGNGNHGTVNGATLTSDRNGVAGKAYSFDGVNNFISVSHSNSLSINNEITLSCWIYSTNLNTGSSQTIISKGVQSYYWNYGLSITHDGKACYIYTHYGIGTINNLTSNSWHNITITINQNTNTFTQYFDGIIQNQIYNLNTNQIITNFQNMINSCCNSDLNFGKNSGGQAYFSGKIDDIAIYNRALTQAEITALYTGNPPCTPTSSNFNLTIPSTSLPYTWNGLTFNSSGSQTAHLTNAGGCDSAVTLNLTVTNTIPAYIPTNGLVGWWPFNGNANDESGNGNHGTVNGATLTSDRNGTINNCYSFNSNNQYIQINGLYQSGIIEYSISGWFKKNSSPTNQSGSLVAGSSCNSSPNRTGLRVFTGTDNKFYFGAESQNCGNGVGSGTTQFSPSDGIWHHYVVIFKSQPGQPIQPSCFTIFIDGNLSAQNQSAQNFSNLPISPINNNSLALVFGNSTHFNDHFPGSIDDIAIYNRALSQQEITALYSGVVSYNFNASSGPNGYITPTGNTNLNQGSTQSYNFTPNTGYLVDSVIVDGNKVDSIQGYTFSNISANHSIRVTFKVDSNNVSMNFPTGISYQAVARDSAGKVLANSPVKLRFSIKENSMYGNTVYSETANLTTNKLGLFTCIIGNNNAILGNYKNIDWMGASKFLQVELEQAGNYVLLGSQQLLSVPYANAANKSKEASKIKNANLPVYPDNNAALQGGMQAGEMYRTAAGDLKIVY